jgi:hypothetical protein
VVAAKQSCRGRETFFGCRWSHPSAPEVPGMKLSRSASLSVPTSRGDCMKPALDRCSNNARVAALQGWRECLTAWPTRVSTRSSRRCTTSSATAQYLAELAHRIGQAAGVQAEYFAGRLAGGNRTGVSDDAENWKSMRAPHEGGCGQRSPRNYSGWGPWLSDPLLAGRRSQRVVLSTDQCDSTRSSMASDHWWTCSRFAAKSGLTWAMPVCQRSKATCRTAMKLSRWVTSISRCAR